MGQRVILAYLLRLDEIQSHNSARPAVTGRIWAYSYVRLHGVGALGLSSAFADLGPPPFPHTAFILFLSFSCIPCVH